MEPCNLRISKIIADDLPEVLKLHEQSGLSAWNLADYTSEIKEEHSLCLLARCGREIGGFLVSRAMILDEYAELLNIAVSNVYRRQGIGQKLLEVAVNRFKAKGLRSILLEVRISNQRAINFYEKNDFSIVAERKNFYVDPVENAYTMRKIIK